MHPAGWVGAVISVLIAFLIFAFGMQLGARNYGPGWLGPGMMTGYATGPYGYRTAPWMMGPNEIDAYGHGPGPWIIEPYWSNHVTRNLSVDDVKTNFGRWLVAQGNPRVKLGTVSEKDADTITADIVTTDKDGLVQRFAINRHTGFIKPDAS